MGRRLFHRGPASLWAVPAASPPDPAAVLRKTGNRHGGGQPLNKLGIVLTDHRKFAKAIPVLQDATASFRAAGDRHGQAEALSNLGFALLAVRRFEEAIPALQDATAIFKETGDHYPEGRALNNLGVALQEAGRPEQAISAFQGAAAVWRQNSRQTGDPFPEAQALSNLAVALREADRSEEATTALHDAARCPAKPRRLPRGHITVAIMFAVLALATGTGALVSLFERSFIRSFGLAATALGTGWKAWRGLAPLMTRRPPFLVLTKLS